MVFEVLHPGLLTTIQDGGRYGVQDLGVPVSGFMDASSAQIANALVGNHPNAAVFEMCQKGFTIKIIQEFSVAFFGAHMELILNHAVVKQGKVLPLKPNDILSIGYATKGIYGYLAICGDIDIPKILNSKSTYLPAGFGGFRGRALKKGDIINIKNKSCKLGVSVVKAQNFNEKVILQCFPGLEWEYFSRKAQKQILEEVFTVGKDCNRIGYRLEGENIELSEKKEIISSGIVKGTVQITSAGNPIVMMADAPTAGGYLRVLNLTDESCNKLAQAVIGSIIKFEMNIIST